jgi:hypothetical protein
MFTRDGDRIRAGYHVRWRGWITHRDTDQPIRDNANWNEVHTYRDGDLVRIVTTGAVWRLVIPGHGIVMHQSGRYELVSEGEPFQTPFSEIPDFERGLCRYL